MVIGYFLLPLFLNTFYHKNKFFLLTNNVKMHSIKLIKKVITKIKQYKNLILVIIIINLNDKKGGKIMSKKLFVPGPIDVSEDVLGKMATQVISHRGIEASKLQENITKNLQIGRAHV